MPDENITVEPHGTDVNTPNGLSPADQEALKHDLGLPKGSKEFKQAAKKWKKKTNDLKKAAKAAQDAAAKAGPADAAQAQGIADDASARATDLEGTVLKGFGGTITITRITIAGVGVAIIIAVV